SSAGTTRKRNSMKGTHAAGSKQLGFDGPGLALSDTGERLAQETSISQSGVSPMKTMKFSFTQGTLTVLLMTWAHCPQAGPIPKLFNTGVDDSGALLADSQVDP